MKIHIYIALMLHLLAGITACDSCLTESSQYDADFATVTMHEIKDAACSCQCTGQRDERNRCLECEHIVAAIPQGY